MYEKRRMTVEISKDFNFTGREKFIAILIREVLGFELFGYIDIKAKNGMHEDYVIISGRRVQWDQVTIDMCCLTYGKTKSEDLRKRIDKSVIMGSYDNNKERYLWILLKKCPAIVPDLF